MAVNEAILSKITPTRLKMSYEEFLAWADEDTHVEWVDGEVIVHMPPKNIHQTTLGFLYRLLGLFVDLFGLGKVGIAPFEVKLMPDGPSREPDLFFIANENLDRLTEDRLVGPADLIIEIVSTDSVRRDRQDKLQEYRDAGVQEYWVIDPRSNKQRADFYQRDEKGEYQLYATEDDDRAISQVLPGFWLRPAWLWQVETLSPLTCCLEIEGVAAALSRQLGQVPRSGEGES
ncbi:MAG TPA: Uma2 family endonuclease [Anaerolineae bacterium]|jgi:Uma2 family endonuclease